MDRRWSMALLLVCLLLPSAHAASVWPQFHGSGGRDAVLEPFPRLLDVLEVGRLRVDPVDLGGMYYAPVMLRDDDSWIWSERHPPECLIVARPSLGSADDEQIRTTDPCDSGLLQALDPLTERVLLCTYADGDQIILRAVDPDGRTAWSITPNGTLGLPSTEGQAPMGWRCQGTAVDLDERLVYSAFHSGGTTSQHGIHRIAAFRLDDGEVVWQSEVRPRVRADTVPFAPGADVALYKEPVRLHVGGLTLTQNMVVVSFAMECPTCPSGRQVGFAWLDRTTGERLGTDHHQPAADGNLRADDPDRDISASRFAVARDGQAIYYRDGAALFIDPDFSRPIQRIPLTHNDKGSTVTATPVWWNQYVIVPSQRWLSAIDTERGDTIWEWSSGPNWHIEHVALSEDGELLVLLVDIRTEAGVKILRLSAASGTVIQELSVALDVSFDSDGWLDRIWRVDMLQGDAGEVVLADQHGGFARLGPAPATERYTLAVSAAYPAINDRVRIDVTRPRGTDETPDRFQVAWGDGTRRTYLPGEEMTHRYAQGGDRDIYATLLFPDNTTRTAKTTVHVGGTPPRELTPLQQVFAPENADITWGIIGVLIAIFGGLMAIARSRVRKNRLEYRLAQIERIKKRAEYDTPGAIQELDAHRMDLRSELRRGKLDDIQYAVLETEIQRSLRLFYHRLLTPYEERMSARFRDRLTASLEDGTLHPPEAARLRDDLAAERRLSRTEKDQLDGFLRDWSRVASAT